ncbi:MAG: sensor histidine kinase [Vicinamibacterales bacterium]
MIDPDLQAENARLRARLDAHDRAERLSRIGSWTLGSDGRFEWSDTMFNLFGLPPGAPIPSPQEFAAGIHPDDRAAVWTALEGNWAGVPTSDFDYRMMDPDGSVRYLRVNAELWVRPDGTPCVSGTTQDVTHLHATQAQLRVTNLALESALNAFAIAEMDGRITYVNPAALRLWECGTADRLTGRQVHEFWEDPLEVAALADALKRDRQWTGQLRARTLTGRPMTLLVSATVVVDEHQHKTCLLGAFEDITDRLASEAALRASVAEKDALLRELHHRVKNNLQVVASLLRLEGGRTGDGATRAVLVDMQHRVASMALVHELLHRSGQVARVDLGTYLESLARHLFGALAPPGRQIALTVTCTPARVDMDQAVPCGLLVNELLANSLKHAFPAGRVGDIAVECVEERPGALRLTVRDTGIGLPTGVRVERPVSLGLQLVSDLTRQLRGTLHVGGGPGTSFTIVFAPRPAGPDALPEAHPLP